jgi:Protein of unknown function (DUF2917)
MLNTQVNLHSIKEVTLAKHTVWTLEGDRRGDVISCGSGILWITQEGDLRDYVLEAGGSFWVTKPGAVIVQALDTAHFKYNLNEMDSYLKPSAQPTHNSSH